MERALETNGVRACDRGYGASPAVWVTDEQKKLQNKT